MKTEKMNNHPHFSSCYGIGAEELIRRWLVRERAYLAVNTRFPIQSFRIVHMRRELQEAMGLVADPAAVLQGKKMKHPKPTHPGKNIMRRSPNEHEED